MLLCLTGYVMVPVYEYMSLSLGHHDLEFLYHGHVCGILHVLVSLDK